MYLHSNQSSLLLLFFVFCFFINAEVVLFQNSELLINVVLFMLVILLSSFFQLYNFYNVYYYYSYTIKRDSMLHFAIILSLLKKYNLLNFRTKIYLICILAAIVRSVISNMLHLIHVVYMYYVINITKYFETKLFVILFSIIPFFMLNINSLSILSVSSLVLI